MSNWGIDNWMCDIYKPFNSCYLNTKLSMINHVDMPKERYEIDRQFINKLKSEIKYYVKLIKKYLDQNGLKYNITNVNKILNITTH